MSSAAHVEIYSDGEGLDDAGLVPGIPKAGTMHHALTGYLARPRFAFRLDVILYPLILVALVALFYHAWLRPGVITAGDFPYFTPSRLRDALPFPSLWDSSLSTGAYNILQAPMFPLFFLQGVLAVVHINWDVTARIVWIYPAVVVPCAATYTLSLSLFRRHRVALVGALAAVMNSYVYLLYQGGQFGVAMGFGCMPLVLWAFIRGQRRGTVTGFLLTGLLMAVQAMYDIRSTYISLGVCLMYGACSVASRVVHRADRRVLALVRVLGLPHIAVALAVLAILHSWWILPALFVRTPALPPGYTSVVGLRLLSYMNVSNALSLFHPFWYANDLRLAPINPLFFAAPLFVFGVLLYRQYDEPVLFLTATAVVAAFLVKGSNGPGGAVYEWLFVHVPGFSLFRDPSKFFQPLALAYSLLLGLAAETCHHVMDKNAAAVRKVAFVSVTGLFLALAVFPAYPALLQQARGTFAINPVPAEYARFNNRIDRQPGFFRVLWVPARPLFGTFSNLHPALDAAGFGECCIKATVQSKQPWSWINSPMALQILQALSVRYVVVPDDITGEAFKPVGPMEAPYVPPSAFITAIRTSLPALRESTVGHLHVFVNTQALPLVFATPVTSRARHISHCASGSLCMSDLRSLPGIDAMAQPAHGVIASYTANESWYDVRIHAADRPFYLVLQQTYDPNWLAFLYPAAHPASQSANLFARPLARDSHVLAHGYANAWLVRRQGDYHVILEYWPQRLVLLGWLLAVGAVLCCASGASIWRVLHKRTRVLKQHAPSHMPVVVSRN